MKPDVRTVTENVVFGPPDFRVLKTAPNSEFPNTDFLMFRSVAYKHPPPWLVRPAAPDTVGDAPWGALLK